MVETQGFHARAHHAEGQSLLEQEKPDRADAEPHDRVAIEPVGEPARSREGPICRHGQGRDVADAALSRLPVEA